MSITISSPAQHGEKHFTFFRMLCTFQWVHKILDAWGWCTGTTQRDGMGREEGGGFRMGNTCIPVVDSF